MKLRWRTATQINPALLSSGIRDVLLNSGSLTGYLESRYGREFNLELKGQSWQRPLLDEIKALHMQEGRYAFVREIYLKHGAERLVYARSIIPAQTFSGAERRLAYWGKRSLGDYLFTQRRAQRGNIEIARIAPADALYQLVDHDNPGRDACELWGRRSLFYIKSKPLLVVEIFLSDVITCISS